MNLFWLDASALAKRYTPEKGTTLVNHFFDQTSPDEMICLLQCITFNPETDDQQTLDSLLS
jgi:hypothetical protein